MTQRTLIIGIGNRFRGDDALGCIIIDKLQPHLTNNTDCIEHDGEAASLIDSWSGYNTVILIDAVSSGSKAGTIHSINLNKVSLPDNFKSYSTHAFGLSQAVELARVLQKLPKNIIFYGVEGGSFSANTKLTEQISKASKELISIILKDIKEDKHNA